MPDNTVETSSIVISHNGKDHEVPEGFTAQEGLQALANQFPELENAQLKKADSHDANVTYYKTNVSYGTKG